MKRMGMRGITILELMVVVLICGILMSIGGFSVKSFIYRYGVERQVRELHADLLNARGRAFEGNRRHFITVSSGSYQITEDTNQNGGPAPDDGDTELWHSPKKFRSSSQWAGIIIMDTKGIVSVSSHPLLTNAALAIRFDTAGTDPFYDCISLGPTRIVTGKWNGKKCELRG